MFCGIMAYCKRHHTGGHMANRRLIKKRRKMLEKKMQESQSAVVCKTDNMVDETLETTKSETVESEIRKGKVKNMKSRFFVQYQGNEFEEQEVVAKIKQEWKEQGNKIKDLKELDVYAKPEEGKVYYTINGEIPGSMDIF